MNMIMKVVGVVIFAAGIEIYGMEQENVSTKKSAKKTDKELLIEVINKKDMNGLHALAQKGVPMPLSSNELAMIETELILSFMNKLTTEEKKLEEIKDLFWDNLSKKVGKPSIEQLFLWMHKEDGYSKIKKAISDYCMDVNTWVYQGEPALHHAIRHNKNEVAHLLLDSGALPNGKGKHQESALHTAVFVGNSQMVKVLLDNKADINQCDARGLTPLHTAVSTDNYDLVKQLLVNKAARNILNKHGETPLDICALHRKKEIGPKQREIIDLLEKNGAKRNATELSDEYVGGSFIPNNRFKK